MLNRFARRTAVLFAVLVLLLACPSKTARTSSGSDLAPDFTLNALDGGKVTLSALRGKPVVIDFWGTWCPPCIKALNDMVRISDKFGKRVTFLGVALNDRKDEMERVRQEKLISYQLLFGTDKVAKAWGVEAVPTVVVLDRNGKVAWRESGFDPDSGLRALERTLVKLTGGKDGPR
jgi:thiol-disulfide isomerase/thioredoxin